MHVIHPKVKTSSSKNSKNQTKSNISFFYDRNLKKNPANERLFSKDTLYNIYISTISFIK